MTSHLPRAAAIALLIALTAQSARAGEGLAYTYDDKPVISIACDEPDQTYFSVWPGERPGSRTVKESMLEGRRS